MLVVFTTFPDAAAARAAGTALVTESLAACASLFPAGESIYRWEGKIEHCSEVLLMCKTLPAVWPVFQQRMRELHPYSVPEIIALPAAGVSADYLRWVGDSVAAPSAAGD